MVILNANLFTIISGKWCTRQCLTLCYQSIAYQYRNFYKKVPLEFAKTNSSQKIFANS